MRLPTTFLKPESDWQRSYDVLLKSLQSMCAHDHRVTDQAAAAAPELVPRPSAVTRDSGLLGFTIQCNFEVPVLQDLTITRGDTIIVDPRLAPAAGDAVLVSDGSEFTLVLLGKDELLMPLTDNTGEYLEDTEVLLIGVLVEVRKVLAKRLVKAND